MVVTLLLGSLVLPFAASADSGDKYKAKGWVSPDAGGVLEAGGVIVEIPAGAVDKSGPVVMHVTVTEDGVTANFVPPYEFSVPVTVTFPSEITTISYVKGNTVETIDVADGVFSVEHFSRYSGWF